MKNFIISILIWASATLLVCCATSCTKDTDMVPTLPDPIIQGCQIDITKFQDVLWVPMDNVYFAKLEFYSNGVQFQQDAENATWSLSNGCDSVKVTRGKGYFYRIKSVTKDTLKLINPLYNEIIYHK